MITKVAADNGCVHIYNFFHRANSTYWFLVVKQLLTFTGLVTSSGEAQHYNKTQKLLKYFS